MLIVAFDLPLVVGRFFAAAEAYHPLIFLS
jgi:hypothetical protein